MRIGGAGMLGLGLGNFFQLEAGAKQDGKASHGRGSGKAKQVVLLFLQGGPSHIDLWDPKPDAPENIRGRFAPLATNVPGIRVTELMPRLAKVMDKATLIRSVSYTPAGLFNHTAAMYQMLTGYTPDRVSPSGQLDPPGRLPVRRLPGRQAPSSGGRDAALRDAPAAPSGVERDREGWNRRIPGARVRPVLHVRRPQRGDPAGRFH
jgi:hypothetical protein